MSNILRKILDLQRPTYCKFRGAQLNLSTTATLSTEESGRCGEVAVMGKSRLPPQLKKKCVCGHIRKRSPLLLRSMVSYYTDKTQHRRSLHKSADDGSQRLLERPHQKRRPLRHSSPANRNNQSLRMISLVTVSVTLAWLHQISFSGNQNCTRNSGRPATTYIQSLIIDFVQNLLWKQLLYFF